MGREYIRLRSNTQRENRLDRAKIALEVDQDSEAIDLALEHIVESIDALEDVKEEISPELAKRLSTSVASLTMYPQVRK